MIKRNTKKGEKPGIIAQVSFARKKFRFSDWFAERFIKAVAVMSIAVVTLIVLFVFLVPERLYKPRYITTGHPAFSRVSSSPDSDSNRVPRTSPDLLY